MGILNVTPDSFSDGGEWVGTDRAIKHALDMVEQGVDIIDIGGESTRPGSLPVSVEEELNRLEPVLEALLPSIDVPVSVDTMKPAVAERCIDLGVSIVNDVMGLRSEGMLEVCADYDVAVVIMHMEGDMSTVHSSVMGCDYKTRIREFLIKRTDAAISAGISENKIILDPGIGFGKTSDQNIGILSDPSFFSDGYPVLIAASRKRFLSNMFPEMDRDEATIKASLLSLEAGADIVRVHDVAHMVDAIRKSRLVRQ